MGVLRVERISRWFPAPSESRSEALRYAGELAPNVLRIRSDACGHRPLFVSERVKNRPKRGILR
jgi:hypothetical protein